jgi:hypothetical protein
LSCSFLDVIFLISYLLFIFGLYYSTVLFNLFLSMDILSINSCSNELLFLCGDSFSMNDKSLSTNEVLFSLLLYTCSLILLMFNLIVSLFLYLSKLVFWDSLFNFSSINFYYNLFLLTFVDLFKFSNELFFDKFYPIALSFKIFSYTVFAWIFYLNFNFIFSLLLSLSFNPVISFYKLTKLFYSQKEQNLLIFFSSNLFIIEDYFS